MIKIFMLLCLVASSFGWASDDADGLGRVDFVVDNYQGLVIDDSSFAFALSAKVFDLKGKESNRYLVKPGDIVRFHIAVGANGYNQLTHVWLMPANTDLSRTRSGGN